MRNPYHKPRAAHCIGCGHTFDKMHLMKIHRNTQRCGGRFLPADERELVMAAIPHYQRFRSTPDWDGDTYRWHYTQYKDMISRFFLLRKRRLDESSHQ